MKPIAMLDVSEQGRIKIVDSNGEYVTYVSTMDMSVVTLQGVIGQYAVSLYWVGKRAAIGRMQARTVYLKHTLLHFARSSKRDKI